VSTWKNPSFNGAFLPDDRTVSEKGFVANWNVLHLNRNYPQIWTGDLHKIESSSFGIDLLLPVDNYQKSYRSIQYAILFIGFTFLVFFFIEVLYKRFIHPIQYLLVGISELEEKGYLYLLGIIPVLVLLFLYVQFWKRKKQREFGDIDLVRKLSPENRFSNLL
jgi:inner membrane protein involved in colicin E2 resistance